MASDDDILSEARCHSCAGKVADTHRYCPHCGATLTRCRSESGLLLVAFVALPWLILSLLILSEPSPNLLLFVLEFYLVIGLLGLWVFLLLPAAYRRIIRLHARGISAAALYLAPLPLATGLLVAAVANDVPLKARLELSEGALIAHAEHVDSPDADYDFFRFIGLFRVQSTYKWDGCTIFVTDSFGPEDEGGLAYCTGRHPCAPTVKMHHIKGPWWRWNYWHTNERC